MTTTTTTTTTTSSTTTTTTSTINGNLLVINQTTGADIDAIAIGGEDVRNIVFPVAPGVTDVGDADELGSGMDIYVEVVGSFGSITVTDSAGVTQCSSVNPFEGTGTIALSPPVIITVSDDPCP